MIHASLQRSSGQLIVLSSRIDYCCRCFFVPKVVFLPWLFALGSTGLGSLSFKYGIRYFFDAGDRLTVGDQLYYVAE